MQAQDVWAHGWTAGWRLRHRGGKWCLLRALGTPWGHRGARLQRRTWVGAKGEERIGVWHRLLLDTTPTQLRGDPVPRLRGRSHKRRREAKHHCSGSASNRGERGLCAWILHKDRHTGGRRFTHLSFQLKQHTQKSEEGGASKVRGKGPGADTDHRDGTRSAEGGQGALEMGAAPRGAPGPWDQRRACHGESNKRRITIKNKLEFSE